MDKLGNHVYQTLPPEDDDGDVEYKWSLAYMNRYKRNKIASQMRWRVKEASGNHSALYILGVHDNGQLTGIPRNDLIKTIDNLMDCASKVGLYTCLRKFERVNGVGPYWAIMQIFEKTAKTPHIIDHDIPEVPHHPIPNYLLGQN